MICDEQSFSKWTTKHSTSSMSIVIITYSFLCHYYSSLLFTQFAYSNLELDDFIFIDIWLFYVIHLLLRTLIERLLAGLFENCSILLFLSSVNPKEFWNLLIYMTYGVEVYGMICVRTQLYFGPEATRRIVVRTWWVKSASQRR